MNNTRYFFLVLFGVSEDIHFRFGHYDRFYCEMEKFKFDFMIEEAKKNKNVDVLVHVEKMKKVVGKMLKLDPYKISGEEEQESDQIYKKTVSKLEKWGIMYDIMKE
jgi:hypothetical protein